MPDLGATKAGTIVAAAMESAGTAIQSDMLNYVLSNDGMLIAGLFYLIAIVSGIIVFTSGGAYKWGRYLLVGPSLFLFLTEVRTQSDGTEWSFGKTEYSQQAVEKVLTGVRTKSTGDTQVSLFFNFWNVFMSEVTQKLISFLNLNTSDSNFNFIQKVERLMLGWNFADIHDADLRFLVQLTLGGPCSRYFALSRAKYNINIPQTSRDAYAKKLAEIKENKIAFISPELSGHGLSIKHYLNENNLKGSFTCPQLWKFAVDKVRLQMKDTEEVITTQIFQPEQKTQVTKEIFNEQVKRNVNRRSGMLGSFFGSQEAAELSTIDWMVSKALFKQVWGKSPYVAGMELEGHSGLYQSGLEYTKGNPSGINEMTSSAINQFEETNKYAERSRFTTAALSLPYFQGIGLCMLAGLYPFFAMAVVLPGRAQAIFAWMGLWAWLKLWDLGFAVVMLIDNMLYAMFPRGLSLKGDDVYEPGLAWSKILEMDPNYSQSTYYTILSTCLFAVPFVTGVFVKMGGGELVNIFHDSWSEYSSRIGGAAASFARSIQAQGYMKNLQEESTRQVINAAEMARIGESGTVEKMGQIATLKSAIDKYSEGSKNSLFKAGAASTSKYLEGLNSSLKKGMEARVNLAITSAKYAVDSGTIGRNASEMATAARYYSHDLVDVNHHPGAKQFDSDVAQDYYPGVGLKGAIFDSAVTGIGGSGK